MNNHISSEVVADFQLKMESCGLSPPHTIIVDGAVHRFHITNDKKGTMNGWYKLYPDFPFNGSFGNWRDVDETFRVAAHEYVGTCINYCSSDSIYRDNTQDRQRFKADWDNAFAATDNCQYLKAKRVKSFGLRYSKNAVLVPVVDCDGNLYGVQRIYPDGSKRFAKGTDKSGHFFRIGNATTGVVLIAEGYATGATLHEITGQDVVVAFDAGNLLPVAKAIRGHYQSANIVMCADDDQYTEGNPGLTFASKAATEVGGLLIVPSFNSYIDKPSDFNDLCCLEGPDAVLKCLAEAGVSDV
jgi:putative DNA primase/helicase